MADWDETECEAEDDEDEREETCPQCGRPLSVCENEQDEEVSLTGRVTRRWCEYSHPNAYDEDEDCARERARYDDSPWWDD